MADVYMFPVLLEYITGSARQTGLILTLPGHLFSALVFLGL